MEFLNGIYKKEVTEWDELLGTSLLNQEVILEGAVHSIRNMGDVAFVILRRREGLFQTVVENEKANLSVHDLKEAMTLRVKGILNEKKEPSWKRNPYPGGRDSFSTGRTDAAGN